MLAISNEFITTMISAASVIVGSLIGGVCSWIITKHSMKKNIQIQYELVENNRKYEELKKMRELCENINIIRLDVFTSIFQCIRNIKELDEKQLIIKYPIPIYKDYSKALSTLMRSFTLREMSYIYQLYAIIENLNSHINETFEINDSNFPFFRQDCVELLKKVYGENYLKILQFDIEETDYKKLYENKFIKDGYRKVFRKIDNIDNNDYIKNKRKNSSI